VGGGKGAIRNVFDLVYTGSYGGNEVQWSNNLLPHNAIRTSLTNSELLYSFEEIS
jgi:hypothetical protein